MPGPQPLVRVIRSGLEESVHLGHVAVCDAEGRLLASVGDPGHPVFARSSMKPVQAAASLRRIEVELADDLVAVMCGSHAGEPAHVRAVRRLLRAGGASESELACPAAYPLSLSAAIRAGRMRRVYHNCSGKHAGMVVAADRAGWGSAGYLAPRHPLQRDVLRAVRRATGVERPAIGVDGCGAPVFGVPLSAMATAFARLARPQRLGAWSRTGARAVAAMLAHPQLVSGPGRTDTVLMDVVPGVLSKGGAEALHCAALLEPGIGVAVKIADGANRAGGPALVRALRLLGAISDRQFAALGPVAQPAVTGGGAPVGEVVASFQLLRHPS
jgi:L-asparaginase II